MTTHTPGPWVVYSEENDAATEWSVCHDRDDSHHLCVATALAEGREEARANATLIAAAPDLLAACKAMVAELNDDLPPEACAAWDAAVAAIAKAEGR